MLISRLRTEVDGLDDGSCSCLAPGCGSCDSVEGSADAVAGRHPLLRVGAAAMGVDLFVWQLLLLLHAHCQLLYTCELPLQVSTRCIVSVIRVVYRFDSMVYKGEWLLLDHFIANV